MKQTVALIEAGGFVSSSNTTEQFKNFFKTFKKEFTKEMQGVGATDIVFNRGHFYVSGFFTIDNQAWYFSIPDVRGLDYRILQNPDSNMYKMMYREAKDYKDFTGGVNRYAKIRTDMSADMCWYFKIV